MAVALLSIPLGVATVARAGPAPAIAPSRVVVDEPLGQDEDVRLPDLHIMNQGDEAGAFTIDVTHFGDQVELAPESSWFELAPLSFALDPGASETVSVRMRVPRDAVPGEYRALLRARVRPMQEPEQGRAVVSAAVAMTLIFTVENRNFEFYDPVVDFFNDRSPFSYIGLGLLLAAAVLEFLRRRFRLRVSMGVERRE